ncbi:hypothetical protein KY318_03605, partial [Candidatus Woesearchaeota archaeon]|nr:hypothetical protein [Candidatus Woesearchaeota archaeon]
HQDYSELEKSITEMLEELQPAEIELSDQPYVVEFFTDALSSLSEDIARLKAVVTSGYSFVAERVKGTAIALYHTFAGEE